MSELLPSLQAQSIRDGLSDYLTTTFALADRSVRDALQSFLDDPEDGMFSGPYVRTRMPFRPAAEGWRDALDHYEGFPPYGHQAAAFARLTSKDPADPRRLRRPEPTMVTTGTGSGKTEAFLAPILDHVLRARALGITGIKALILYPMNALATDQAKRLTELLTTDSSLSGVRAGIYIGSGSSSRTTASPGGLISSRHAIREDPPDILLTNYKMLDQLLLRPEDAPLWEASATSLTYLVLDEFHTYDGAQGTDVAMLLRRLGLALTSYWPVELPTERSIGPIAADRQRPLGMLTPVATSATLGGKGDPEAMLDFARTVFGEQFPPEAVITESRLSVEEWAAIRAPGAGSAPAPTARIRSRVENGSALRELTTHEPSGLALALWPVLFGTDDADSVPPAAPASPAAQADALARHPLVQDLLETTAHAIGLDDLALHVLGAAGSPSAATDALQPRRRHFVSDLLGLLSHLRKELGRTLPSIEVHLWVRELSRLNRELTPTAAFSWADDGAPLDSRALPAMFCRRCGRSGWAIEKPHDSGALVTDAASIRRASVSNPRSLRVLLHAPEEGEGRLADGDPDPRLGWYDVEGQEIVGSPAEDSEDFVEGRVLPVLLHRGDDADVASSKDRCPACGEDDAIRFVGSAIATLLSVSITTQFGESTLDENEKKALVFADSVQDAAHRAGFVQSRSHVFSLRSALAGSVPAEGISVEGLVRRVVDATITPAQRYTLIPPDLTTHPAFQPYWDSSASERPTRAARRAVETRLQFDADLEFGMNSHLGRTLELTGAITAEVDVAEAQLLSAARAAWDQTLRDQNQLDVALPSDAQLLHWTRGVLVRMRQRGAILHPFLDKYVASGGDRYHVWGGRNRRQGAPAFPKGRPAPAFPHVGSRTQESMDPVVGSRAWYARWAGRCLEQPSREGGFLAKQLLTQLAKREVITSQEISTGEVFFLRDSSIMLRRTDDEALRAGEVFLECGVCHAVHAAGPEAHAQLTGSPCLTVDCSGKLAPSPQDQTFYRRIYLDSRMRRVVAHEHTSLLPDAERLTVETQFKSSDDKHPAAPNVLVATPTLEMGIDIGDLSTVMLSSLPRSVAGYLQRVGRAGRLTGNSLILVFARGRGEHLPKIHEPLSVLNGEVRPPATYLGAGEILRRQYLAFLLDRTAREVAAGKHEDAPRDASLLGSIAEGTVMGRLVREHDDDAHALREEFLAAFGTEFDDRARGEFLAWTEPVDGASGLWHTVARASKRYAKDLAEIDARICRVEAALPELDAAAQAVSNLQDDEAQRAPKIALASLRNLRRQRSELRGEHWVAALERYGLLPNFTLFDDAVGLDVEVTFRDHDTDQFDYESLSFSRGASTALTEFAPGNTFYGQGREIRIDSVDVGTGGSLVQRWQICPDCGWVDVLDAGAPTTGTCARCRNAGVRDVSQVLDVLPFTGAGAVVRRDESAISDRSDDRARTLFTVATLADLAPEHVEPTWWVDGLAFGVQMAHRVMLRRLNLGRRGGNGADLTLGGTEYRAPRFRVCESCGQLDSSVRSNSRSEHRPWCPHRTSTEEHARSLVLAHSLETQGILLRLPRALSARSGFALPSLKAAVLLGLREVLGGSPDHLDIVLIADPDRPAPSLLLHDTVPGGTGYLIAFSTPDGMRTLLEKAFTVVAECECRAEERMACHRCLLPFAAPHETSEVSRAAAAQTLAELLTSAPRDDAEGVDPTDESWKWKVTYDEAPPAEEPESHLEVRFRNALRDRLKNSSWRVTERPGDGGMSVLELTDPAGARWTLSPQPSLGFTRPDFELARRGSPQDRMLIYTDGYRYHATVEHNRIAEDIGYRARIRDEGLGIPWAITMVDVAQFETVTAARASNAQEPSVEAPGWYDDGQKTKVLEMLSLDPTVAKHIPLNSMEQLVHWMQRPDRQAWEGVAESLPMIIGKRSTRSKVASANAVELAVATMDGTTAAPGKLMGMVYRRGALAVAAVGPRPRGMRIDIVIDDRLTLDSPDFAEQWREWLHLANLVGLRQNRLGPTGGVWSRQLLAQRGTDAPAGAADREGAAAPAAGTSVGRAVRDLVGTGGERTPVAGRANWSVASLTDELALTPPHLQDLLDQIAKQADVPRPTIGAEIAGGVVAEISWSRPDGGPGVAIGTEDPDVLTSAGWQVTAPHSSTVLEALSARGLFRKEN
ncbi:DEAD/DEAH box helicase [Brachybacterium paraconglomeratum]|uniref:DEAD/DEAH box helicase n=1 Tax=Brachybacterium paraconglomeratum TaxID=173362 RepID=UPI00248FC063|nr:DEAD/DEAH box helicase [Brachybacterium paraconglomeratum]